MKVTDCYKELTLTATTIKEHASLQEVVNALVSDPRTRSVYVINDQEKLIGVITVKGVLEYLGRRHQDNLNSLIRDALAKEARDLMESPINVTPETDMEEALNLAIDNMLEELPVCKNGKVIGDLTCFEIINSLKGDA
ncbi:CBS domain-containing protein [archaeon]|nr:CBS domain-containing protein [archaeon]